MQRRFELVENFIRHGLRDTYNVTFKPHAIVTTASNVENMTGNAGEIVVISPETCPFPPMTNWWFAANALAKSARSKK